MEATEGLSGGSGPDGERPPPGNRMVVAVLALMGFFVSLYLFLHYVGVTGPIICGIGSCELVQASRYAWIGPIPVPALGLVGYGLLLGIAVAGVQPSLRDSRRVALLLFGGSTVGVAFSAWLTYLEAAVIHAWCLWCVVSACLMTLTFLACLPEARRAFLPPPPAGRTT